MLGRGNATDDAGGRFIVKKENALVRYFRETRVEVKRVRWPTREETWRLTRIVLVVTVSMALFLWLMDLLFSWWLRGIIESDPWRIAMGVAVLVAGIVVGVILGRQQE
ncbi:MAG: preprotein translocase subunit SecE [Anaerolineae bacterium]|nr:preprotein translocase subunit SecE [Anaerolineae bacterium]